MQIEELRRLGFFHYPNAVSTAEQAELVRAIDQEGHWEKDYERLAQRHGYRYEYKTKTLVRLDPLVSWIDAWAEKVYERRWLNSKPDQVTVQWYEPNTGIGDHRDDSRCFGPEIATISLLAPCMYRLQDPKTKAMHMQLLEPGCVVILSGEARTHWKHGIPKTEATRIEAKRLSVTFRTVNPGRVRCSLTARPSPLPAQAP